MNFPKGKWITIPNEWLILLDFPKNLEFPGVYVFFQNKKDCFYVGSSNNIRSRILEHIVNEYVNNPIAKFSKLRLQIKVRKDKYRFEYLTLEARLIYKINPRLNKRHLDRKKLKNEIKQDIKRLTEDLKPILLGEKKRLIHIDKEQELNQPE